MALAGESSKNDHVRPRCETALLHDVRGLYCVLLPACVGTVVKFNIIASRLYGVRASYSTDYIQVSTRAL